MCTAVCMAWARVVFLYFVGSAMCGWFASKDLATVEKNLIFEHCVVGKVLCVLPTVYVLWVLQKRSNGENNSGIILQRAEFSSLAIILSHSFHRVAGYVGVVAKFVETMTFDEDISSADSGNFIYLWYFSIKTAMRIRVSCGCLIEKAHASAGVLVGCVRWIRSNVFIRV